MAKNLSLVLNLVLLAAVGYLYYYNFSGRKTNKGPVKNENYAATVDSNCKRPPIAYVELDSLNENITYIKDKRKELDIEQKAIEEQWQDGYRGLEAKKNNFLKKGAAITQEEAQDFQGKLMQEQQQIDNKKQELSQKLSEKSFSFMDDIQKRLKEFLTEYNKEKKYMYILTTGTGLDYMVYKDTSLNITNDVIKGMNEKMKGLAK
jgi:outer membrane protein